MKASLKGTAVGRRQPLGKQTTALKLGGKRKASQLLGVSWDPRRHQWKARFNWQRKEYFLGRYDDAEAAGRAYDIALDTLERASQQQAASSSATSSRARLQTRQRNFEEQRFHDPELEAKVLNIYYAEQYSAQTDVPDAEAEAETETVSAAGQSTPCTSADNDTAMQLDGTEAAAAAAPAAAAAGAAIEREVGDTGTVPADAAVLAADSDLSSSSARTQQQQQQAQQLPAACLPQQLLTASLPQQHASDGRCLQPTLSTPSSSAPGQNQQQQLLQPQPEGMHWEQHPAINQHLTTAALTQQHQQQQQVPADTGLAGSLPNLTELLGGLQPAVCAPQAQQQQDADLGFGTLLRMGSSAAAELLGQALEELAAAEGATAAAAAAAAAAADGDCDHYQQQNRQQQQQQLDVQGAGPARSTVPACSDAHNSSPWQINGLLQPVPAAPAAACEAAHLVLPICSAAAAASAGQRLPQPQRQQHQQQQHHQQQQVCVAAPPGAAAAAGSGLQEQACLPVEDPCDPLLGLALSPADVEALLASVAAVDAASLRAQHSTAQHTAPPAAWVQQPTWQPGYGANHQQQQQLLQLHTASLQQQEQQQQQQQSQQHPLYHDVYGSYSIDSTQHVAAAGPKSSRAVGGAWPAGGIAADASLPPAKVQHSMQSQEPHLSQQQQQQHLPQQQWQQQQQQYAQGGYQVHSSYTQPQAAAAVAAAASGAVAGVSVGRSASLLPSFSQGHSSLSDTLLQHQSSSSLLPDFVLPPGAPASADQQHSMLLQPQQVAQGRQLAYSSCAGVGRGVSPFAAAAQQQACVEGACGVVIAGDGGVSAGGIWYAVAGAASGGASTRPGLLSSLSRAKALSFTAACMQAVFDLRRQLQQQHASLSGFGGNSSSLAGGGSVGRDSLLAGWLVRLRLNLQAAVRDGSTDGDVAAAIAVLVGRMAQRLADAESAAAAAAAAAVAAAAGTAASILPVGDELVLLVCLRLQRALWGLSQLLLGLPRDGVPLRGVVQGWVQSLRESVGGAGVGGVADAAVLQLAGLL